MNISPTVTGIKSNFESSVSLFFIFFFTSVAHVVCELTKWKKVQSLHGN